MTRPVLHQTVGAAMHTRADLREVILRCPTATSAAHEAARKYNRDVPGLKNRTGNGVQVTLAVGRREG